MIGIYQDSFVDYLQDRLGIKPKVTTKNIITKCPWCEYGKTKEHYHMYISLEAPIFHCFKGACEVSGTLNKLLRKLEGTDISDSFVDKDTLKNITRKREVFVLDKKISRITLPPINKNKFRMKEMYLNKRLKFTNIPSEHINGLIFDVEEFISINKIPVDPTLFRMKDYLQNNFVGFLTENESTVIFRNIDHSQTMRYFKLKLNYTPFLDYYRLPGNSKESKQIVLGEGIFDIFSESIFDNTNLKDKTRLYATALSSKYSSLILSLVFNEQVFQPDVVILSDRGIELDYYKKIKKYFSYVINTMTVFYNKAGKDFNDTPVMPVKFVV